jgi:hypothetical protein
MRRPDSKCFRLSELAATLLWQLRENGHDPRRVLEGLPQRVADRIATDPHGSTWAYAALLELLGPEAVALVAGRLRSRTVATVRLSVLSPERRNYGLYALVVLALEDLAATGRPAREALLSEIKLHLVLPQVEASATRSQGNHGTASPPV